jgi:hypothetical protein
MLNYCIIINEVAGVMMVKMNVNWEISYYVAGGAWGCKPKVFLNYFLVWLYVHQRCWIVACQKLREEHVQVLVYVSQRGVHMLTAQPIFVHVDIIRFNFYCAYMYHNVQTT